MTLYTVGHSNQSQEDFLQMIQLHDIDCIADVRSVPASNYSPQFNQDALESFLRYHDVCYFFLGNELGARRIDALNEQGQVDFEQATHTPLFKHGVEHIQTLLQKHTVSLMCSEANPLECHRFALVARYFHEQGVCVQHILKDGTLINHSLLEKKMVRQYLKGRKPQLAEVDELFGTYTPEDQLHDAYRLKNKEIGYMQKQTETYYD